MPFSRSKVDNLQEARRFLRDGFFVDRSEGRIIIADKHQTYLTLNPDSARRFLKAVDGLEAEGLVRELAINAVASRLMQDHLQLNLTFPNA